MNAGKLTINGTRWAGKCIVTPEQASIWLGLNTGNRRVRKALVNYIASQIASGEWQEDHPQPIVFSDAGRLIDGQHRLHAIVQAKTTVTVPVVCGVPDKIRSYLDTGISRTLEDRVEFVSDINQNACISQMLSALAAFRSKRWGHGNKLSPETAIEMFTLHKDALIWVAENYNRKQVATNRVFVRAALMEFYEHDSEKCVEFADSLQQPDGPIQQARMLRDFLLRNSALAGSGAHRRDMFLKCTACMVAYMEGRPVKQIRAGDWSDS